MTTWSNPWQSHPAVDLSPASSLSALPRAAAALLAGGSRAPVGLWWRNILSLCCLGCERVWWGMIPPCPHSHTRGGAEGEGAFPHGHKTIPICLQDRPHRWVSWGHAAAGTCGKEMSLCSALDICVIQSIAPMCKKSTKVAPLQMAGNAECQGQRQILSQSRALFYFNWVGLGEATEVVWGWGRQQCRLGTSHCPFL